jgi:hypothetical protein
MPPRPDPSPARSIYCLGCLYPLGGLPEPRCPECGRPFDPDDPKTFGTVGRTEECPLVLRVFLALSLACGIIVFIAGAGDLLSVIHLSYDSAADIEWNPITQLSVLFALLTLCSSWILVPLACLAMIAPIVALIGKVRRPLSIIALLLNVLGPVLLVLSIVLSYVL